MPLLISPDGVSRSFLLLLLHPANFDPAALPRLGVCGPGSGSALLAGWRAGSRLYAACLAARCSLINPFAALHS